MLLYPLEDMKTPFQCDEDLIPEAAVYADAAYECSSDEAVIDFVNFYDAQHQVVDFATGDSRAQIWAGGRPVPNPAFDASARDRHKMLSDLSWDIVQKHFDGFSGTGDGIGYGGTGYGGTIRANLKTGATCEFREWHLEEVSNDIPSWP